MNDKKLGALVTDLERAAERYEALRTHFERFCAEAQLLADHETSPARGLFSATKDTTGLELAFLDRRIKVSLRFEREHFKGVLYVEDESAASSWRAPETIERIEFNSTGETLLDGGFFGDKLTLGLADDCHTLALRIIDAALDRNPWEG